MRLHSSLSMAAVAALSLSLFAGTGCSSGTTCDGVGEMCRVAGDGARGLGDDNLPAIKTPLYLPSSVRVGPDGLVYVMDLNNYYLRVVEKDGTMRIVAGNGLHVGSIDGALATATGILDPIDFAFRADGRNIIVAWHDPKLYEIGLDQRMHLVAGRGADGVGDLPDGSHICYGTGDGGPALEAGFCELDAIAVDKKGRVFLADDGANQIRMIDVDGTVSTLAGDGKPAFDGDGGPAVKAHLDTPGALAIDVEGNLLVADTANQVIRKIDMTSGIISTVVGTHPDGFTGGFSGDGGPCLQAQLFQPGGIAVDSDGAIYVSDTFNSRIRRVDPTSEVIDTYAGTGASGLFGDNGPALEAKLNHPARLSITDGTLYIADQLANVARSVRLR
ncbi:MAG: hypothetical protein ABI321_04420 [Polyangia bacterium]